MTNDITITANSEQPVEKQLAFMSALPSDILLLIFACLSKKDCLMCAAVCRDWYNVIPQYTQQVWKKIRLVQWDAQRNHSTLERFLGSHVKCVTIAPSQHRTYYVQEHDLRALLQKLLDWGCTDIESLELEQCEIKDEPAFLDSLRTVAPLLTHLEMSQSICSVDILNVLYMLPRLTHFTCQYNPYFSTMDEFTIPPSIISTEFYTKIKYLRLEINLTKEQKEAIVRRCPDLRCYIDTSFNIRSREFSVDLDSLFSWCPKITFLETSNTRHFNYVPGGNEIGLRYFHPSSCYPFDHVVRQLKQNQHTLEHLSIDNRTEEDDSDRWFSVFQSLHLPSLRTLILDDIKLSSASFLTILSHSPALELLHLFNPAALTLDSTCILSLHTMERLHTMKLHDLHFDGVPLLSVLERFPALEDLMISESRASLKIPSHFKCLRHLKQLQLSSITWENDGEADMEVAVARFFQHLTTDTKIKHVWVIRVPMPGSAPLLPFASIPTLKELTVVLDQAVENDGLLKFIVALRKTAIHSLTLREVLDLPFAVLNAIAELPLLTNLYIEGGRSRQRPIYISHKGFQQVLSKSSRLTFALLLHNNLIVQEDNQELTSSQVTALVQQDSTSSGRLGPWSIDIQTNPNGKRIRRIEIHRTT